MALGWRGSYFRYKEFFLNIANFYKNKPNARAFLEVILSISTVTVFLLFALKPTALTIIDLVKEIREKKETVAGLDKKIKNLQTAAKVLDQNQSSIPQIDTAVPSMPKPEMFSEQVLGLATKNGVDILGISVGTTTLIGTPPSKKGSSEFKPLPEKPGEMPVSVSVKGAYTNLLSFIKDVENLRIVIKLDSVGINSSETESGQVIVAVLAGRVPYLGN